mgnify:FL=1
MSKKTFAIITDIHANTESLKTSLSVIDNRDDVDQVVCLGDCFPLGPNPEEALELLLSIKDCIYIRGNHDRYILERLWEQEQPTLEGMDPYDPICQEIVQNIKWASQQVGKKGKDFIKTMHVAHREIIDGTLVEFTHAWYQRDDQPPTIEEAYNWRNHVIAKNDSINQFIFIHGHTHIPRHDKKNNLLILCPGATGLPFDKSTYGSVGFLTVGESINWDVHRYEYDTEKVIQQLEEIQPPFYKNLQNTLRYACIRNDI